MIMENATHVANPVRVNAVQLVSFGGSTDTDDIIGYDAEGNSYTITAAMRARYEPESGDYFVTQEDGYRYVNPRDVFERKYQPLGSRVTFAEAEQIDEFLRGVGERAVDRCEPMDMAVVVYGSYGGHVRVESINGGIDTIGLLRIGEQIMLNTIMPNGNITS